MRKAAPPSPREVARSVLREKGQGRVFPTNLQALLADEYVETEFFVADTPMEGRIELCRGKPAIYVNTRGRSEDYPRNRFTFAHEIGHYYLHRSLLRARGSLHDEQMDVSGASDPVEREAHEFASEALLPEGLLKPYLRRTLDVKLVDDLATLAGASLQTTAIRFSRATQDCVCFFLVKRGSVKWTAPSDEWLYRKLPCSKFKAGPLPEGAVAASRADDFREVETKLTSWAPRMGFRDVALYESALETAFGRLVFLAS